MPNKRGTVMQASLAVVGAPLSIAVWFNSAGIVWLVAGLLLGSVVLKAHIFYQLASPDRGSYRLAHSYR